MIDNDYTFVMKPTIDKEELEKQFQDYQSLPYKQRRLSDDECIKKYGVNNQTLFDRMFSYVDRHDDSIETDDIEGVISEAFQFTGKYDKNVFMDKIARAKNSESCGYVLIYPYDKDFDFVYSLDDLEKKFAEYQSLSGDLRNMSDQESIKIFGNDVLNMYNINKVKILSGASSIDVFTKSDIELYRDDIRESTDSLNILLRKLDMISIKESSSLLESAIATESVTAGFCTDPILQQLPIPQIVPYLSVEEIKEYCEDSEFIDEYDSACSRYLEGFDYTSRYNEVKKLYNMYQESKSPELESKILSLGWNPSVEPNEKNMKIAHDRIRSYIESNYYVNVIDISKMQVVNEADVDIVKNDLYPVFIVLSFTNTRFGNIINKVKQSNYSHAAITFESDLEHLYSFNAASENKLGGLSYESISEYLKKYNDARIKVLAIFVNRQQKNRIRAKLDWYIGNARKTKYNIPNLFNIILNRAEESNWSLNMICSQFVDSILRTVNIDLTNKSSNLVAPADFERVKNNKVYTVYEGLIRDYNKKKVDTLVRAISSKRSSQYKILQLEQAVDMMFKYKDPLLYKSIYTTNESANTIIDEINDLLQPTSIFSEAIKLPVSFKNNGDLEINLPNQVEAEYQKSHKLLVEYEKAGNIDGMKSELAKLWRLNNTVEKRLKIKKSTKLINLRSRILNDFKKYIKKVLHADPSFNFTEYFNKSPYYDKTITVDANTLKWSGKLLKSMM